MLVLDGIYTTLGVAGSPIPAFPSIVGPPRSSPNQGPILVYDAKYSPWQVANQIPYYTWTVGTNLPPIYTGRLDCNVTLMSPVGMVQWGDNPIAICKVLVGGYAAKVGDEVT
jgi:hypothetical protein